MKPKFRLRLKSWLKKRISFRLHMSIIMFSTVFLGMVSNFLMLNTLGVTHPALRYPLTILLSYGWFLLFIRIYIKNILIQSSGSRLLDFIDLPIPSGAGSSASTSSTPWTGGGGTFSGGGSTGDWGAAETVTEVTKETAKEASSSVASSLIDDDAGAILLLLGGVFAAIVLGSGAYFIWHSPEILSECLLQVILVSGMRKKMKKFSEAEWLAHIFKVTVWPFVIVLVVGLIAGGVVRAKCPTANSLKEIKTKCWTRY